MTIFVDADACPVKEIIVREAKAKSIPVTMLADTSHVLADGYSSVVTVARGRDSADFKLVTLCHAGDVVVTQDYGVAAMALGKGARCVHPSGLVYTNSNIDQILYQRHESAKARRRGRYAPVPKRTAQDDAAFCTALRTLLTQKGGTP